MTQARGGKAGRREIRQPASSALAGAYSSESGCFMKRNLWLAALFAGLLLSGCRIEIHSAPAPEASQEPSPAAQSSSRAEPSSQTENSPAGEGGAGPSASAGSAAPAGETDSEAALAIALENAGTPKADARNVKVERDEENGVSVFQVEFETEYGDYDFEIAAANGEIVGADYEVDEEWLDRLGGSPVTLEEAKGIVQGKVSGSRTEDIQIWEEGGGRGRFEGELFHDGMKYEFEIDPNTGIIFDWNADLRE